MVEITYKERMDPEHVNAICKGLNDEAYKKVGMPEGKTFSFSLFEGEDFYGGIKGYIFHGCCYIDIFWIDEKYRGCGYGKQLIDKVEDLARKENCLFLSLRTMEWEARPFYEKCGFELEYTQHGFLKDNKMYYLRKELKE